MEDRERVDEGQENTWQDTAIQDQESSEQFLLYGKFYSYMLLECPNQSGEVSSTKVQLLIKKKRESVKLKESGEKAKPRPLADSMTLTCSTCK